jgi:hypothetical protein
VTTSSSKGLPWSLLAFAGIGLVVAGGYRLCKRYPAAAASLSGVRMERNIPSAGLAEHQPRKRGPGSAGAAARVDRRRASPEDERTILLSHEAMERYATILASLHLPPERLRRLRDLIVEREESAGDAEALAKDYWLDPADAATARAKAEADFDRAITDVAGLSGGQEILEMLSLTPQLADITGTVDHELAAMGSPLTADQLLALARAYKNAFAPSARTGQSPFDRTEGFDPQTGLAGADREILARASGRLTPEQLEVLRNDLAKTSTAYAAAVR